MGVILSRDTLDALLQRLRADGRRVIGPTRRDGTITPDEISSLDDLPAGWTEEQDGGRYRLEPLEHPELFGHATPSQPWKRWLYPERTLLMSAERDGQGVVITEPEPDASPQAFFGIRSCDVHAIEILDRVMLDPPDPTYAARRKATVIVAAACARPGGTCFCSSMGTGPSPSSGYDIAITELCTDTRHEFYAEAGTETGTDLLEGLDTRPATGDDLTAIGIMMTDAAGSMGRKLDPTLPSAAAGRYDHPHWNTVAERCLACANCTLVCPTCFCSTTEDTTDLAGIATDRWRTWDSCFTLDFTFLAGAPLRSSVKSRYRQWLLHKLVTWHDQFGTSGCVGCGRCITWCPVAIDLTAEIAAVAQDPGGT